MPANIDVQELQNRVASSVDQSATAPTAGGDTWNLRLRYLNRSQNNWADTYNFRELYKEFNTQTSTSTGNTSISMPTDFHKLASYPKITGDGVNTYNYPDIRPEEKGRYGASDRYFYLMGNPADGYVLVLHAGTSAGQLASGASIQVPYYASPASLASPADKSMCPNPEYLVKQSVAYLWEAGEDPRFPQAKVEAEKELLKIVEQENTHNDASEHSRIRSDLELKYNFRPGK